jgi:predicted dehydrogenase
MAVRPLRIAIVGLGRMGRFHAAALAGVKEVEVAALVEPSAGARELASALLPEAACYADVAEGLAHPALEACLVASPTSTHPAVVDAACRAGLHVLCEKPLALDSTVGSGLEELAALRELVLQIGFWRRFAPPWRVAKERIDAGDIGTPLYLRLSQWDADPPPTTFCDPSESGGLPIDCGVHEYDLAEWLTDQRIVRIVAWPLPVVDQALGAAGDLDNLVAVLELCGGAVATVDLSRNARYGDDVRTEVLGSSGTLLVELLPEGRTRLGTVGGMRELPDSRAKDAMAAGVAQQARAFAAAVRGEPVPIPTAASSIRATQVGHAVAEAARTGAAVELKELS